MELGAHRIAIGYRAASKAPKQGDFATALVLIGLNKAEVGCLVATATGACAALPWWGVGTDQPDDQPPR